MVQIAPSILAADFARLGEQVLETERAGAQRIHIDVMDGHFVRNLSMGPVVVKALRKVTRLPLEVHLMVEHPGHFAESFIREGADRLIAHIEVTHDAALFKLIRDRGKGVGLAVNPETDIAALDPYLSQVDLALCMTVHPGFGGQTFLPDSPARISKLKELIRLRNPSCELEVDGGIDAETAPKAIRAGADVLVIGTAVFGDARGPAAAMHDFAKLSSPS